jgi:NitT/TauT family transport system ATP-binding protein
VNPEFLILDEPFASLDYITQQGLITELDMLFSVTKKTSLLVTHNIEEAIYLSDRIIILGGRPATIHKEIRIDFDHPRKIEIKNTKKYANYIKQIKNSYL